MVDSSFAAHGGLHSGALRFLRLALAASCLLLAAVGPASAADETAAVRTPENAEYRAAIKSGDRHFLAKQFAEAERFYQEAVERLPDVAEAYGRLAAAQRELGKFDEAVETLGRGLQTSSTVTERAKLVFLQADIRERQRALPQATERWNAYLELAGGGERTIDLDAPEEEAPTPAVPGATVYPATAHERLKQIAAAEKRFKEYGVVKERIKKREQAADVKARNAK
jgi:tetratricopeptide (TPR) repeat protein